FRQAVAEGDTATTLSVLSNHGGRIGASRMILVDLEGIITADTTRYDVLGTRFPFNNLLSEAVVEGRGTALAALDGEMYWIVVVPVKAPVPIAFIAAGIPVDAPLLEQFSSLSALPHSLVVASVDQHGEWTVVNQSGGAMPRLPEIDEVPVGTAPLVRESEGRLAVTARLQTVENSAPVIAILDYPLSEALAPYRAMLVRVLMVLVIALAAALVGAMALARGVSKPLETLASAAKRIASGDYSSVPEIERRDEVGQLSKVLKDMSTAIADRETALMSAVSSLEVARDEAVAANEAKSQFLSNMSHELRTPLNAIIGFSEMIHSEAVGPIGQKEYVEYAGHIHKSGTHLLGQLTAILGLAEGTSGKMHLKREPISPSDIIRQVAETLTPIALEAGVNIEVDAAIDDLPSINGDAPKLHQGLFNLVHNAIKFSPRGSDVEIGGFFDSSSLSLRVVDHGTGIPEEDIPLITRPFHRRKNAFYSTHQGAGVGLPFAKTIVELHGGRLDIESTVGSGTIVTVRLPLRDGDSLQGLGDAA
ncbi:MAG: ATP-binding protein, partial [Alphaproteobacteria bacterium]